MPAFSSRSGCARARCRTISHSVSRRRADGTRRASARRSAVRSPALAAIFCLLCASPLRAEHVSVAVEGVEGDVLAWGRASTERHQYERRDVSPVEVRRLFERADEQIRTALEPFGYYSADVTGKRERAQARH